MLTVFDIESASIIQKYFFCQIIIYEQIYLKSEKIECCERQKIIFKKINLFLWEINLTNISLYDKILSLSK